MALDFNMVLNQMVVAAKSSFSAKWPSIQDLATSSFKKLAGTMIDIEKMKMNGIISESQSKLMIAMDKNSFRTVLISVEGLAELAIEAALNAALDAVKGMVNKAVGFGLL